MNIKEVSFEELVEQFNPLIKKEIKQLNMYGHYDELYQIGLIALWEATTKCDDAKGKFTGFAKKYVKGRMLTYLKSELKFQERYQKYSEPEMIENIPARDDRQQLSFPFEQITQLLTKREQIWFIEFYENGKGPKAIAQQYNVSLNTVKTWRKRAIERISENLKASELHELLHLNYD